ncbi:type IV secretory system conjugative DNA transfer family protein [Pseudonocardia sp. H11422]|uniref:type IV secretory system conjugative DNA transfer family protein n=1 Tax=Pseudonocardia sp. H11422 TaxID=2835866 RepID=UPI001BDD9123|nr:TraM recognition domain-containing protein [Pseudonocardia sp. H11422]
MSVIEHTRNVVSRSAPTRLMAAATATGALGWVTAPLPGLDVVSTAAGLGAAGLAAGAAGVLGWRHHPTQKLRRRLGADGWLDHRELRTQAGARALRAQAGPAQLGLAIHAGRAPVSAFGAQVGRLVSGPLGVRGRAVYSPWSRGILLLGPQGSGKSSWLVGPICDTPGPAYVTSTKTELADMTARIRACTGPVHVFNPTGLGGLASTFRWDPVAGCTDPTVAEARAAALVRGGGGLHGTENSDFWAAKATEIIRCYLLAAALQRLDMSWVMHWAHHPDDPTPLDILEQRANEVPAGWVGTLTQNIKASHNTRTGYFAGVMPAVSFMDNPLVAAACRPAPGEQFDIEEFLRSSGTVYVIAGEDDRRIAPLLTALTEAVFTGAKRFAARRPSGQLDPPFSLFLDEIANITPVPLDGWAADSRGWGITVCAVAQDLSQLQTRWGPSRAKTIFSNLPTRVVLPGVAIKEDLEALAYLGGQREVLQTSEGRSASGDGQRQTRSTNQSWTREPVVTGHTIYGLPRWHAYILGLSPRPAVVRFEPGYRRSRRELRRLDRTQLAAAPVAPTPAEPAPDVAPEPVPAGRANREEHP